MADLSSILVEAITIAELEFGDTPLLAGVGQIEGVPPLAGGRPLWRGQGCRRGQLLTADYTPLHFQIPI